MKVAKEKGLPELKHHLLPRTKGFTLAASQMEGKSKHFSIYLFYFILT
jgi:lysophosphatidic acid acyltransferase/lysophosphatidylinositol acyltransferase